MPRIYKSSVIEAPIQRVWDYIRDFSTYQGAFERLKKHLRQP